MNRRLLIAALAVLLPAGLMIYTYLQRPANLAVPPQLLSVLWPQAKPLQAFQLTDQHDRTFNLKRLQGHYSLLFLGYTYCPDICPTTLAGLNILLQDLGKDCATCQVVFITVDPQRDTSQRLAEYVGYFNPEFIALTGDTEAIKQLSKQMGAMFIKEPTDANGNYAMSHTASVFLVNPQAQIIGTFSFPHDPVQMARDLRQIMKLLS